MVQRVKASAVKAGSYSLILRTHLVEKKEKKELTPLGHPLTSTHSPWHTWVMAHIATNMYQKKRNPDKTGIS